MNAPAENARTTGDGTAHWTRPVMLALLLMLAWVLWSGFLKPLLLALGALSSVLVVYLAHRMRLFDTEVFEWRFLLRLVRYWGWLAKEVLRSSLEVSRLVLSPRPRISPTVAEFESRCSHPTDQAILGNSITLTPGTLTLQIRDGRFVVHALTEAGARDIVEGEMDRRVAALRDS
jgi:multicomponent Na+:H+ antiporter subunit E